MLPFDLLGCIFAGSASLTFPLYIDETRGADGISRRSLLQGMQPAGACVACVTGKFFLESSGESLVGVHDKISFL